MIGQARQLHDALTEVGPGCKCFMCSNILPFKATSLSLAAASFQVVISCDNAEAWAGAGAPPNRPDVDDHDSVWSGWRCNFFAPQCPKS